MKAKNAILSNLPSLQAERNIIYDSDISEDIDNYKIEPKILNFNPENRNSNFLKNHNSEVIIDNSTRVSNYAINDFEDIINQESNVTKVNFRENIRYLNEIADKKNKINLETINSKKYLEEESLNSENPPIIFLSRPIYKKSEKNNFYFSKLFFFRSLYYWTDESFSVKKRLFFLSFCFTVFYITIAVKIFNVSTTPIDKKINISYSNFIERKEIFDRKGVLLAGNIPIASLYANPSKIKDIDYAISKIKTIFPKLDTKLLKESLGSGKNFVWVERDISPSDQIKISKLGIEGIYFIDEVKRFYTQGKNTSHILGYVNRDNEGIAGFESSENDNIKDLTNKESIKLTIDHRVQEIVSEELDNTISKFSAIGGVGIVVDVTNGEVIALVSKPDFDPHKPSSFDDNCLFNKASLGNYEIGSVFKTITFASAIDSGKVSLNDVYNINNFSVSKYNIKDYHNRNGWNSIPQMFMHSSNIGSSLIAMELGDKSFLDYLNKLGFSEKLNIELSEKSFPIYPKTKISNIDLVTMSYGYRISISPLHYVQAMIPVVNGGIKYDLTIIKKGQEEYKGQRVLKEDTSHAMNKLLRLTVEKGTGKNASVKGFLVGGKTGTANKVMGKTYSKNKRISSFVAITPSISPKYLVFVMIDEPKGIKETFGFATAGYTAAPAAGNIIKKISSLYGIKPYNEDDDNIKKLLHLNYLIDHET